MAQPNATPRFWGDTGQKVIVSVAVAVALAALGVAWNFGTGGGVVRALGGATQADIDVKLADLTKQLADLKGQPQALPANAVLAVAAADCPAPWQPFTPASGKFILAASPDFPFNQSGGRTALNLRPENLPQHQHETMLSTVRDDEARFGYGEVRIPSLQGGVRNETGWRTTLTSVFPPQPAEPFDIMPPYYVMQYCRL